MEFVPYSKQEVTSLQPRSVVDIMSIANDQLE